MKHALCLFHFVFCSLVSRGCLCGEWKEMWRRSACFLFTTLPLLLHILFPLIPHPITQEIHLGYLLWLGDTLRSETRICSGVLNEKRKGKEGMKRVTHAFHWTIHHPPLSAAVWDWFVCKVCCSVGVLSSSLHNKGKGKGVTHALLWVKKEHNTEQTLETSDEKETKKRMKRIKRAVFHHLPLFGSCFFWVFLVCSFLFFLRSKYNVMEWKHDFDRRKERENTHEPILTVLFLSLCLCFLFN